MKKNTFLLPIAALTLTLAACGTDDSTGSDATNDNKEEITIKHELGETTVEKNPETVVVFDYGTLDTLDSLDVEVAGIPKTPNEKVPNYLSHYIDDEYVNVGGLKEPDFEAINAMDPDLIIISGRQSDMYDEFTDIAPTIYMGLDTTRYMESFEENVMTVAGIFDKEEEAADQLEAVQASIDELHEEVAAEDKSALVTLAVDGKISAYGAGSRFGMIYDVLGFKPLDDTIDESTHGQNISYEYIVEENPEYLFVVDKDGLVGGESSSAKQYLENELVEQTTASQDDHIVYLDASYWYYSDGGLTSVQGMVDEVAAGL
ncbi:siderophore ABC transporter substrate-binding protein [Jeotgalibacillus marinus]|uniref:Siderophore ABC transporter substrate-binding protein n=1 Tax=Jeotgalibacillus marinus TaxID=86667 RepID=A0ABV3Q6Q3_9BACL